MITVFGLTTVLVTCLVHCCVSETRPSRQRGFVGEVCDPSQNRPCVPGAVCRRRDRATVCVCDSVVCLPLADLSACVKAKKWKKRLTRVPCKVSLQCKEDVPFSSQCVITGNKTRKFCLCDRHARVSPNGLRCVIIGDGAVPGEGKPCKTDLDCSSPFLCDGNEPPTLRKCRSRSKDIGHGAPNSQGNHINTNVKTKSLLTAENQFQLALIQLIVNQVNSMASERARESLLRNRVNTMNIPVTGLKEEDTVSKREPFTKTISNTANAHRVPVRKENSHRLQKGRRLNVQKVVTKGRRKKENRPPNVENLRAKKRVRRGEKPKTIPVPDRIIRPKRRVKPLATILMSQNITKPRKLSASGNFTAPQRNNSASASEDNAKAESISESKNSTSKSIPVSKNSTSKSKPASKNSTSKSIPVSKNSSSKKTPVSKNYTSKKIPVSKNSTSKKIPVSKNSTSNNIPVSKNSTSNNIPVASKHFISSAKKPVPSESIENKFYTTSPANQREGNVSSSPGANSSTERDVPMLLKGRRGQSGGPGTPTSLGAAVVMGCIAGATTFIVLAAVKEAVQQGKQEAPTQQGKQEAPTQQGEQEASTKQGEQEASTKQGEQEASAQQGEQETSAQQGEQETSAQQGEQVTSAQQGEQETSAQQGEQVTSAQQGEQETSAQQGEQVTSAQQGEQETSAQQGEQVTSAQQGEQVKSAQQGEQEAFAAQQNNQEMGIPQQGDQKGSAICCGLCAKGPAKDGAPAQANGNDPPDPDTPKEGDANKKSENGEAEANKNPEKGEAEASKKSENGEADASKKSENGEADASKAKETDADKSKEQDPNEDMEKPEKSKSVESEVANKDLSGDSGSESLDPNILITDEIIK